MADAKKLIPWIKKWEGGFVNDPIDRGGATNKGITISTFRFYYGAAMTVEDLRNTSDSQWQQIFELGYWKPWKADCIHSQSLANICVDWGWASGTKTAIRQVQMLIGVDVDGIVGTQTLSAINSADPESLFDKIKEARLAFIRGIVLRNPPQARFSRGWTNRINDIRFIG